MSDDEFIDPASEVKTLDEMPQFEDENPVESHMAPGVESDGNGSSLSSQEPDNASSNIDEAVTDISESHASVQEEDSSTPLPRELESMVLGISLDDTNSLAGTELEIGVGCLELRLI